jgi:hypothetical protein
MPVVQAKTVVWPKPARPIQERAPDRARFGQRWACLKRAQESARSFRRVPGAKGRPVSFQIPAVIKPTRMRTGRTA